MYVQAPKRSSNGTTTVNAVRRARSNASGYLSASEAMSHALEFNRSTSTVAGQTSRALMQKGIVGPSRYIDTSYASSYQELKSSGYDSLVFWNASLGRYQSESFPLGFGYTGFYSSGIAPTLGDANPNGTGSSVAAIYNRAVITNLSNRIRTELSVKSLGTNFDAAESLTGLAPSVKLVTERVIQVSSAWMALRKGNVQKALDVLGLRRRWVNVDKPSLWLELQYGWLPLLNDIFDGSNEILKAFTPESQKKDFYTVTRRGREGLLLSPPTPPPNWGSIQIKSEAYVTVEAKLRYTIADSFVAYMSQLRLSNPLYMAWTALPYSFVVDWLAPVGDMLSALNAPLGLKFRGGYMTTKSFATHSASGSKHAPTLGYTVYLRSGTATAETSILYMKRDSFFSWPGPALYLKFPFSSPGRIANAIALVEANRKYR